MGTKRFNCTPRLRQRRFVLGSIVRRLRKGLELSQEKLAQRSNRDRQSVCRLEHGDFSPRLDAWWELADALGVPLSELIREVEDTIAARDKEAASVTAAPEVFTPAPPPKVGTDVYKNQCRSGIMAPFPGVSDWGGELIAHYCDDDNDPNAVAHGCGCGHVWDNRFTVPTEDTA